ncbi:ABC transporter permease [Azospira restricta]|uniref:FtsX-like permease family protein n=1 Tax=Azospira restricta TaxID=404405 RepID=A0A974PXK6_9RHOO|nr:FtsX-like permease family protein [Azospira restricta]QRJ62840.1 FtsX-like permease family protein [Azospira restricta]
MNALVVACRLLRRDSRAGELRLLVAAMLIAVAALSAVGFFADRVRQALEREAHQLLGADLLLTADQPWPAAFAAEAARRGLARAETRAFPSMVLHEGAAQLTEVKAVSPGYPLRGGLRLAPAVNAPDAPAPGVPPAGAVWVDERLAAALALKVGDALALGRTQLVVGGVLTLEPDRGVNFFSVAPRLMMNLADLEATGLVQVGSRVAYRLLVAGEAKAVRDFQRWAESRLGRGQQIEDARTGRPEIRTALERAQRFLGLSALLTVVLAAVAVALAARRYSQRHLDPCAVMRCLGATQGFLLATYLAQFALLGIVASAAGCALGFVGHFALHAWLAELLATPLPPPSWLPAGQGMAVGLLLLFGFAVPPLLQLRRVPTVRVLRREFGPPAGALVGGYLLGLAALAGAMFWVAGEAVLGAWVVGGFLGALLVFALVARGAIRLAAGLRGGAHAAAGFGWRYGLANLERHALGSVVQIVALAIGLMALLLLTATRGDLLEAWRRAMPADAPNRFLINIQPEQKAAVERHLRAAGIDAELAPMVRGRLAMQNERPVSAADYEEDRAKRLVEREFNLSWRAELPPGNTVTRGRWFGADEARAASVEEGLAKTLGIAVGDRLQFTIAGEPVAVEVSSLRKLDWDSMRVNFFVLTPPGVLEAYPASFITSFHLPPERADLVNGLIREFPNVTVIDVAAIVRQLQSVLDQVAQAVQFIFLFTLAAGLVVLYAALGSAFEERRYELAVMRSLGARREQLRRALLAEFAAVGALAGAIAALGAAVVGQVLAAKAFNFEVDTSLWPFPAAVVGGAVLVSVAGWLAARRLLNTSPLQVLRAGG